MTASSTVKMAVKYTNTRDNGWQSSVSNDWTVDKAIEQVVKYELAYGTQVTSIEPTSVKMTTHCLAAVDYVTLEGEAGAMEPIVHIAGAYVLVRANHGGAFIKAAADQAIKLGLNNPISLSLFAGVMLGAPAAKGACIGYLATKEEHIAPLVGMTLDDLITFCQLKASGATLDEILAIA